MIERAEWERRFKAHIVSTLLRPLTETELAEAVKDNPEFTPWTAEEALIAAVDEFDAVDFSELSELFEDDPEGSADECMSNWD